MGKKHLDLFPLMPRRNIGFGLGDITRHIASAFMDGAWYLARRSVRAASWFQGAGIAVEFTGPTAYHAIFIHERTLILVGDL